MSHGAKHFTSWHGVFGITVGLHFSTLPLPSLSLPLPFRCALRHLAFPPLVLSVISNSFLSFLESRNDKFHRSIIKLTRWGS